MRSTCRDLARFGLLMLDRGSWGARRVVSASWVAEATGPSSTPLNAAYGLLWWLNHRGVLPPVTVATSLQQVEHAPPSREGRLVPGAPDSTYWALGLGNQVVQVDPGTRTVVVRLGPGLALPVPPTFGPAEASRVVTDAVVRR
jgi:CubicO group peptidase (beta-lactamase class C family)